MSNFLTKIHINKVFHLENIDIELDEKQKKHLILTGKNGSGKTSLLNSIADFFQEIKNDEALSFFNLKTDLKTREQRLKKIKLVNGVRKVQEAEVDIKYIKARIDSIYNKVNLDFNDIYGLSERLQSQDFILAYYSATRKTQVVAPKIPEKPDLNPVIKITDSKIGEFLKFLIDLKIQEALARNENHDVSADEIKDWFTNFTALLQDLFEGDPVALDFNYKDYSFTINQNGRKFGFNELSDGYSAIIDIVADLIIKMQDQNSLTRAYEKEGIVLIDEVETHLHLKLQRLILPMLTQIFPNVQFIVTTHSPFVLSSLKNAIAYDLEKRIWLEDLTEYSYEALAEGYFKVETESSFLISKLQKFKALAEKSEKDAAELATYQSLNEEFASMDALMPPNIKGQYLQIKLNEKYLGMIRVGKSAIVPSSLAVSNCASYGREDVKISLVADQHEKCYLCEQRTYSNFEIEHFKGQATHAHLTYEWTNLFLCCPYCNKLKRNYVDLLNPIINNIEDILAQRINLLTNKAEVASIRPGSQESCTASLLEIIFNGKNSWIRDIRCEILFGKLLSEINFFLGFLLDYKVANTQENKQKIIDSLKITKEFLAFKYWIIKDHTALSDEFEDYIIWNKKAVAES